jgi:hypothetical protein
VTATSSRIRRKRAPALVDDDGLGWEFVAISLKSTARLGRSKASFA